jgi:hypothetical protein
MSTVTTSTNVAIVQRDSSGNNAWVNVLGSANPNKSLGFSSVGAVTALSVPVLSLENTFSAFQKIQTTGGELLRLTRGGGSIDGEGQELRLSCGVSGASSSGCSVGHFSLTSSASTAKNYLRLYDDGISIDNAATDKIIDVNTTLQTVAITSTLHGEGTYGKLHIGGTYLTSLTNSVRAVRIDPVTTLGEGLSTAGIDIILQTAGSFNNDHIVGVQSRPRHQCSGTLNNYYAFSSVPVTSGGLTTNVYAFYAFDTTGTTRPTNQYGIYIAPLSRALTTNLAIYTAGTTPSLFEGNITARAFIGTDAVVAAAAIDWATGASFTKTLSASTTFTFANSVPGQQIVVAITNTVANYIVTWPSSPTLKWSGGSAPTQTIGAKTDVYTFVNVGGVIYGSVVQNF